MRPHTLEDIERDLSLLWEYESGEWTQQSLGEREGLSQSQLSRRLARARRHKAERDRRERAPRGERTDNDIPLMHLTDDPSRERGLWYNPDTDETNAESGLVRVLNGTQEPSGSRPTPKANHNGTPLRIRPVHGGSMDNQDAEPESDRDDVTDKDRERGVVYVQQAI